jgi:prepilin-type N-terminal cleavage/methylation domain-containing protein
LKRQRGFTLLEVAVAMAVFGIFLVVALTLTSEMRSYEKKLPVNFMRHPQIISVIARMRRDVLDVLPFDGKIYLHSHDTYTNGPKTLILQRVLPSGGLQVVVWDLTESGIAKRISYSAAGEKSVWTARGLPPEFTADVEVDPVEFPDRPFGVRIKAKDSNGRLAIDQILQPRTHN